jgi:fatty-acyl-CoA synthase
MPTTDLLHQRARLTPEREAITELASGRRYTYADLDERANRAAQALRQLGVGAGDRVALLAHNSVVYVDLLFGLARIGAIFTPLNWRLATAELHYILNDCQPRLVIVGPEFGEVLTRLVNEAGIDTWVGLEGTQLPGGLAYETLLADASAAAPHNALPYPESPVCILYTSGTTGRPKGAIIPYRQILWNCINTAVSWELTANDVSPIFTPMFHAGGLFVFLTPLLYLGGRVVIDRHFDAEESLATIEREGCTVILAVPTIYKMWLQAERLPRTDFSAVRWFISGGAPCPPSLLAAWREATGRVFRQGYGLTEVGTNCFTMTDDESVSRAGSVGRPIFHSRARLVGEDGRPVEMGQTGELLLAGPHICSGYWGQPEATAQALRDGWFHTGDMAHQDEDGYFYIDGRFKDMIISGGENVYAAEVEAVFLAHPAVAEAALIGQPDDFWGEVGLMAVVLKNGQTPSAADLLDFCRQRLARYKVPKEVVFLPELPYSPYGKVMKQVLKRELVNGVR